MIYLFQDFSSFSDECLRQSLSQMQKDRREYILHFRQIDDRKRSAAAWLLLAYGLKQEYHLEAIPPILRTASGKPFFSGDNMPFFNLSHSGTFAGCALHCGEIGLDIQKSVQPRPSLIRCICTKEELASLKSADDFCRIWSMKESAVKLTGEGITGNFRDILKLHPDMHTYTSPLENGSGFLSYSIYEKMKIPVYTVSFSELFYRLPALP
ncbi:4'-phosphopantetheinyl transferase family protein [Blautia sp. HCP3S3_H10_1]|uniref:4'-phosphopantetheinyl transferase family protein n=1 Tax=unclassified Blautia TaxID=2648079 RepID=UPI003F905BA0|nr:4'-phosphopantetheinyl transferase superfamily protein [Clostridia bacterium]